MTGYSRRASYTDSWAGRFGPFLSPRGEAYGRKRLPSSGIVSGVLSAEVRLLRVLLLRGVECVLRKSLDFGFCWWVPGSLGCFAIPPDLSLVVPWTLTRSCPPRSVNNKISNNLHFVTLQK